MNTCDSCLKLENCLPEASDHYVSLITQHDKMIGNGDEVKALEFAIRNARTRRNAAARLLLAHKSTHEDLSCPMQTRQLTLIAGPVAFAPGRAKNPRMAE